MIEVMLSIAQALPEEVLLRRLELAIEEYKKESTEDNKKRLRFAILLLSMKWNTKEEDISKTIKNIKEINSIKERLN